MKKIKKRVIIVMTSMYLGGAERSLLGLLEAFDHEKYDVSLFLLDHSGELLKYIPEYVNVLPENPQYKTMERSITEAFKSRKFSIGIRKLYAKLKGNQYAKRFGKVNDIIVNTEYKQKYTWKSMPMISDEEFDLAISFMTPHYVTAKRIKAKKKIAWVHTDYTKMHLDTESELKMWDMFDYIAAVSEEVRKSFTTVFPQLSNKTITIENILPEKLILKQADEFSVNTEMPNDGRIKLLSIGRFGNAKNFDQIPDICSRIVKEGLDIIWYIIGYGDDGILIQNNIKKSGMQDRVVILGKKENPYPYIKACNYYIQPSRYEGKSISVREAQILKKPVIITNYTTAKDQVTNGVDGFIVPMDNEGCANGIIDVLMNSEEIDAVVNNIQNSDFTGSSEITKIYKFIESLK